MSELATLVALLTAEKLLCARCICGESDVKLAFESSTRSLYEKPLGLCTASICLYWTTKGRESFADFPVDTVVPA